MLGWEAFTLQRQLTTVVTKVHVVHADISFAKVGSFTLFVGLEDRTATLFVIDKSYLLSVKMLRQFLEFAQSDRLTVGLGGKA